jgi:hypothetical protein
MWIDGVERAKFAVKELTDHLSEPGVVLGESGGIDAGASRVESSCQQIKLSAFAAAVNAFDGDQPTARNSVRARNQPHPQSRKEENAPRRNTVKV